MRFGSSSSLAQRTARDLGRFGLAMKIVSMKTNVAQKARASSFPRHPVESSPASGIHGSLWMHQGSGRRHCRTVYDGRDNEVLKCRFMETLLRIPLTVVLIKDSFGPQ